MHHFLFVEIAKTRAHTNCKLTAIGIFYFQHTHTRHRPIRYSIRYRMDFEYVASTSFHISYRNWLGNEDVCRINIDDRRKFELNILYNISIACSCGIDVKIVSKM